MTHICHFCRRELSVTETVKKYGSLTDMEIKPVDATVCRTG